MEYLEKNLDWLEDQLAKFPGIFIKKILRIQLELELIADHYILFDCPGQVELYTHHKSVQYIVSQLQHKNYRLAGQPTYSSIFSSELTINLAVHLVDSYYCSNASSYVSVLLLTLSTMLQLEMPHVNVLSKIDLLTQYSSLGRANEQHRGLSYILLFFQILIQTFILK